MGGITRGLQWRRAAVRTAVMVMALAWSGVPAAAPAAAAIEGMTVDAATTYRLDPTDSVVRVTVTAKIVNTMPATRQGAYISTPYFDVFAVPAIGKVSRPRARSSVGGSIPVRIERRNAVVNFVVADLTPNLVYGRPQTITITYELPGEAPRSKGATRVNEGFAGWAALGIGDRGKADIVVSVPKSYEVTFSKDVKVPIGLEGGRHVYRIKGLKDSDDAFMFVSALNDKRLDTERISVGDRRVAVKAWPGDTRWQGFATRSVREGLPALEELIGVPPAQDQLSIVESSRTYQMGYAGVFITGEDSIEVGDRLDKHVLLHELSHAWFNQHLFTDRWVTEGLAEEFSNQALDELGGTAKDPKPIRASSRYAMPLNAWTTFGPLDPTTAQIDRFGYEAAYAVIHDLAEDVGPENMQKVLAAANSRLIAYQGDPEAEETHVPRDWRYFYDLLEHVGDSDEAEDLFEDHVLTREQSGLFAQRRGILRAYDELESAGDGWSPPLDVRESLAAWEFSEARGAIQSADLLLEDARGVAATLAKADIDVADDLEQQYENAKPLSEFSAAVESYQKAADDIVALHQRAGDANPVARVGLLTSDMGFDDIEQAMADGDVKAVGPMVTASAETLGSATLRGALTLAAVLLVGLGLGLWLGRRRRRGRRDDSGGEDGGGEPRQIVLPDDEIVLDDADAPAHTVIEVSDPAPVPTPPWSKFLRIVRFRSPYTG